MISVLMLTEEGRGGGALYRIRLISNALRDVVATNIIIPHNAKNYQVKLDKEDLKYRKCLLHPLTRSPKGLFLYLFFFIPEILILVQLILKLKPDIIHVNGSWQIKGVIVGKLTGKKVVWHLNDSYQPLSVRTVFRILAHIPSGFIYASNRTAIYYKSLSRQLYNSPNCIIPAPVDLRRISFTARTRNAKKKIVTIGFLNQNKGIEMLLSVSKELPNLEFYIVGPVLKNQRHYYKRLVNYKNTNNLKNVFFKGYNEINSEFLGQFDFYLCTSFYESSPLVIWEALASGLPVVSTDVGDVKEILTEGKCGFISEDISKESIITVLNRILDISNEEYMIMSRLARASAEKNFDVEKISKQYLRFYSELLSETPS